MRKSFARVRGTPSVYAFALLALTLAAMSGCETLSVAVSGGDPNCREAGGCNDDAVAQARRLLTSGQHEKATALLVSRLKESPRDVAAVELLAETAGAGGDWRLQHASLIALAAEFPESGTIQHRTGLAMLQAARYQRAETGGPRSVSSDTSHPVRDSTRDALRLLARSVQLQPREVRFARDYAGALVDEQQYEQAGKVLAKAMQQNPRDQSLPVTAAHFYEGMGDWNRAVSSYDLALQNRPEDPLWLRGRAMCHYRIGEYQKAADDFSLALRRASVDEQLAEFIAWGDACLKTNQIARAQSIFDRIAQQEKFRTADLELLRGVCRLQQNQAAEAYAIVRSALADWPEHPQLQSLARELSASQTLPVPPAPKVAFDVQPELLLMRARLAM